LARGSGAGICPMLEYCDMCAGNPGIGAGGGGGGSAAIGIPNDSAGGPWSNSPPNPYG